MPPANWAATALVRECAPTFSSTESFVRLPRRLASSKLRRSILATAAEILLSWGQPNEAWSAMQSTLVPVDSDTPAALQNLLGFRLIFPEVRRGGARLDAGQFFAGA